jgi:hypothetical protein
VQGSRQFKDFDAYLVPAKKFAALKLAGDLPLAVATDCDKYLHDRLLLLEQQLETVNRMASANDLPDAIITESGLKITPLDAAVPDVAQALIDQTAMLLPRVKITELLMEVDQWTGFSRHFTHFAGVVGVHPANRLDGIEHVFRCRCCPQFQDGEEFRRVAAQRGVTLADAVQEVEVFRLRELLRLGHARGEGVPRDDGLDGGEWIGAGLLGNE